MTTFICLTPAQSFCVQRFSNLINVWKVDLQVLGERWPVSLEVLQTRLLKDSCSARGKSWPSDLLIWGSGSSTYFVSVVRVSAGSLKSAYMVTVTFVFAEPLLLSRVPQLCLLAISWLLQGKKKQTKYWLDLLTFIHYNESIFPCLHLQLGQHFWFWHYIFVPVIL